MSVVAAVETGQDPPDLTGVEDAMWAKWLNGEAVHMQGCSERRSSGGPADPVVLLFTHQQRSAPDGAFQQTHSISSIQ